MVLTVAISSTDSDLVTVVWNPLLARNTAVAEVGWQDRERKPVGLRKKKDTGEQDRGQICRMGDSVDGWTKRRQPRVRMVSNKVI